MPLHKSYENTESERATHNRQTLISKTHAKTLIVQCHDLFLRISFYILHAHVWIVSSLYYDQLHIEHDDGFVVIGANQRAIAEPQDLFQNPRRPLQAPVREDSPPRPPSLRPWKDCLSGASISTVFSPQYPSL